MWKAWPHDIVNLAGLSRGLDTSLDLKMLKNIKKAAISEN